MVCLVLLVGFVAACLAAPVEVVHKYNGDKVIQAHPKDDSQLKVLEKLQNDETLGLDFWVGPNLHVPVDVHVPSVEVDRIIEVLKAASIKYEVKVENLQSLIDAELAEIEMRGKLSAAHSVADDASVCPWWYPNCDQNTTAPKTGSSKNQDSIVGKWATHSEVNDFLARMQSSFGSRATVSSLGKTFEGRDMRMIKISNGNGRTKPGVFIESTIHAREWLTQGTTNYLIDKLTREYDTDVTVKSLLDSYDFYIIPVSNPDGYVYTRTARMWRKTRSHNSGTTCRGADPNRNFDFHWAESGTSDDPCSDIYPGTGAFSEIETRNIRDAVQGISNLQIYFAVHSYSQLWLTPWAYANIKPKDNGELTRVANIGAAALRQKHGTYFQVGSAPDILYPAGGGSEDWAKGVAGVKYAYALELRPSGNNWNGFVVSESTIVPSGEEVFEGINAVCHEVLKASSG